MRIPLPLITLLSASTMVLALQPSTQPTTKPSIVVDLAGTEVINLWPAGKMPGPTTQAAEEIIERVDANTGRWDRTVRNVSHPTLTRFSPAEAKSPLAAVIVIPGGGYSGEVFDREGYFIADNLKKHGIAAFVLKYRLPYGVAPAENETPAPIADVQRAVRLLRTDASKFGLDAHRIGVMGFSAGGHVAGSAATQFDAGDPSTTDAVGRESSRPDFAVLMYAVSSMHEAVAHLGSRKRLLGDNPTKALEDRFSTAQRITKETPPLFLVHAKDDKVVKIANSEEIATAAKDAGVPCKFIMFETGGHGFGLARPGTEPAGWMDPFFDWLDKMPRK
jgi:acetyl esterase/lipase